MIPAEAAALAKGDYVASHLDDPAYRKRRVSAEPYVSAVTPDIVRVRCFSWSPVDWLDMTHFVKVPKGADHFDVDLRCWVRKATEKESAAGLGAWMRVGAPVPPCEACARAREVAA